MPKALVPVARKIFLQVAVRDIGQLTDFEPRPTPSRAGGARHHAPCASSFQPAAARIVVCRYLALGGVPESGAYAAYPSSMMRLMARCSLAARRWRAFARFAAFFGMPDVPITVSMVPLYLLLLA